MQGYRPISIVPIRNTMIGTKKSFCKPLTLTAHDTINQFRAAKHILVEFTRRVVNIFKIPHQNSHDNWFLSFTHNSTLHKVLAYLLIHFNCIIYVKHNCPQKYLIFKPLYVPIRNQQLKKIQVPPTYVY